MKNEPTCNREDCLACENGKCLALSDNNFGNRECPFYKNKDQIKNTKED